MPQLSVSMPSSIVYVAGYVNDVTTIFTQSMDNSALWMANVDMSENNLYHIRIEAYDAAGNKSSYEKTIEYISPVFIFDRTEADVEYVKLLAGIGWKNMSEAQKREWMGGLKGCLNKSDLKRMENDVKIISEMLRLNIQTSEDNIPDIPRQSYFEHLLENVRILRDSGYIYRTTPEVPEHPLNTYQKINDMEHILHDIYYMYIDNNARFIYCGETYAGEQIDVL